ncbi:FAD-dependent oxidoreductase [Halobacillus salinus]|uniref:Pyridine nucleotide-disulfide oxidoreductase n=1 Tax=Halobacillus salinus TaxID=192814 RepID=A0A4Z0GXX2_9BACI|nr:FAD-dependent oxidoreductase [Halobacillus salinus]TGB01429.1 pyridine nucleotide-disulfide oxidoreductase [Halobacillus salinus]
MKTKVVVVGGVAGGASFAARWRRLNEEAEIIMFEKGPHVSFSNCSLPYHLSGIVGDRQKLVLMDPEQFDRKHNIEARVNSEVIHINREKKTVTVQKVGTDEKYEESYDQLVLSTGANPVVPKLEGIDLPHVFTVRNVVDIGKINEYIQQEEVQDVAVIGGGFIGVEVAENVRLSGLNVSLVEFANQIMTPFDYDMAQVLHKEMIDHHVNLIVGDGLKEVQADGITLQSGKQIHAQAVILAIGVRPETTLAESAGLEIGETGGIKVNQHYLTSDPTIYAVGDAIEVYHQLMHQPTRLALAGPAQRQARAAADHLHGIPHRHTGVIGSSSIHLFDLNAASTGLNEKTAKMAGISYDTVYIMPNDKVGLMPNSHPLHFKLLFEYPTGKILGAQAIGKGNADKRIDVIATMITMGGTLDDLKELELTYSPMLGTAKDVVNMAALVGLNLLHGNLNQVPVSEARNLVESGAFIIDVRERKEYEAGHLRTSVNIPMSEFRDRLDEIPKDRPVYLHCRTGQRSYNVYAALRQLGFEKVQNISGSYLGISHYEYYDDQRLQRDPIVTEYNFK